MTGRKHSIFRLGALFLVVTAFGASLQFGAPGRNQRKTAPAPFAEAAKRNAQLRTELNWILGGKSQRGWYLYTPLINSLLHTEKDDASVGFAAALARWQKTTGLTPSGVLDEGTLYAMISYLQGRRI